MAEEQKALQLRFLNLQDFTSMIAVIDTVAGRGAFKAEEFSAVGNLRDKILAESQHQSQLLQEAKGATTTTEYGGSSTIDEDELIQSELDVPKADRKHSKRKK